MSDILHDSVFHAGANLSLVRSQIQFTATAVRCNMSSRREMNFLTQMPHKMCFMTQKQNEKITTK